MNTEQTTEEKVIKTKSLKKYKAVFLTLSVIIVAGLIYIAINTEKTTDTKNDIVATVNGEAISKTEFDRHFEQDSRGIDSKNTEAMSQLKTQVMDEMIGNRLLVQAASKAGIKAAEEDIDSQVSLIEQQAGGKETFLARLSELGIDESKFRTDVENQIIIQEYLLKNINPESITVTDEEISSLYEKVNSVQDNLPPLSEVKQQIAEQIKFEKQQELADNLVKSLRDKADIKIF